MYISCHGKKRLDSRFDEGSFCLSDLILIYIPQNDPSNPVASRLIRFGNLALGADPVSKNTSDHTEEGDIEKFAWLEQEYVIVVVLDRWEYTPQSEAALGEVAVPVSIFQRWVLKAEQHLEAHPEIIEVAGFLLTIFKGSEFRKMDEVAPCKSVKVQLGLKHQALLNPAWINSVRGGE